MNLNELLVAGGASLLVAVAATALASALAVACGALDAWGRLAGRTPRGLAVYAPVLLAVLAAGLLDDGVMIAAAGLVAWLNLAEVVWRSVSTLCRRAFIDAARLAGLAPGQIVARHVLPHLGRPVALRALLAVPQVLAADALRQLLEAAAR